MKYSFILFALILLAPPASGQKYNLLLSVHSDQNLSDKEQTEVDQFNDLLLSGLMLHHKFHVYSYSPTGKQVGKLLENNVLSQTALAQPYSLQALQQVAAALHIEEVLDVTPFFTKGVIQATVRIAHLEGAGDWQVNFTNTMHLQNLPAMHNMDVTRRSDLLLALMTDQITGDIGIPTHYAAALSPHVQEHIIAKTKSDSKTQKPAQNSAPQASAVMQNGIPGLRPPLLSNTVQGEFTRQAQLAGENKDYLGQAMLLRSAINQHPFNAKLRIQLIETYQKLNLPQLALAQVVNAQALMPANNTLRQIYGKTLLQDGNTKLAMQVLQSLVIKSPSDPDSLMALADAQVQDNHFGEALINYQKASAIAPDNPVPHQKMALVYALQAEGTPAAYQSCLKEIQSARSLIPPANTVQYNKEYKSILLLMDARLRDIEDSVENTYQSAVQGTVTNAALQRAVSDLGDRTAGASTFLQNLPTAAGYEAAQNHYSQAAALLIQSIASLQNALNHPDTPLEEIRTPLTLARMSTIHALNRGRQLLDTNNPASNGTKNNSYVTQN